MAFVGIDIDGLKQLKEKFRRLPPEAIDGGADEAYDYLLRVMREYPPQKRVTRRQAYGVPFFSMKQQRFFFAALRSGQIKVPYGRTQKLSRNWQKHGDGRAAFLANSSPYAEFMYDDSRQSRMSKLIGWKTITQTLEKRKNEIIRRFDAGAKKAIKKLGL